VFISLAVPAGALTLIVTHDGNGARGSSEPTTTLAPNDSRQARVGTPAPDFTLRSTAGKTITLSKLRGRPVVIAFFASWCHPCEEELPVLARFQREHPQEMTVIGVNFQDLASDSAAFVRRLHVTFPALLDDPSGPVGRRYGVRGLPQAMFIDAAGIVRGRVYGQTSRRDLQPAISDLLAGRNVRPV
jgi:peroxiredoxin